MALTSFNVAIVAFVALGSYTYAYAYAIFSTTIGQAGFYVSFGLDRKSLHLDCRKYTFMLHLLTSFSLATSEYTASVIGAMSALFALGAGIGALLQGVRMIQEQRPFNSSQHLLLASSMKTVSQKIN